MRKLTAHQIVHLHQMARHGLPIHEISRALQLNRNSVTAHLAGDVTYPQSVLAKIGLRVPLVDRPWLDHRAAAPWIPGHPAHAKMHRLMCTQVRSQLRNGRRVTRLEWIAEYCSKHYHPGIWIRPSMLQANAHGILPMLPEAPQIDRDTTTDMRGKMRAYPLCVAYRIAADAGAELQLPAWLVHRATRIEQAVGTALI